MADICVLGAGGTGQCFAADATLAGHTVTLWDSDPSMPDRLKNGIVLTGKGRTGTAVPALLTSDLALALSRAKLVVVCMVATAHQKLAEKCAPLLTAEHTVFLSAGNAGSIRFYNALAAVHGPDHGILTGELEGNFYPCRRRAGDVYMCWPLTRRFVSAYPSRRTPELQAALEGILETAPGENVLAGALNSPNAVIHLMASLLNLGKVEDMGASFALFTHGMTPAVVHMIEAMNDEKERIYAAYGWTPRSPMEHCRRVADRSRYPELDGFRALAGPDSATHRYFSEDAYVCACLMTSLGQLAGVPTPLASALLALAGALHNIDYAATGNTLKNLGLARTSVKDLLAQLQG